MLNNKLIHELKYETYTYKVIDSAFKVSRFEVILFILGG